MKGVVERWRLRLQNWRRGDGSTHLHPRDANNTSCTLFDARILDMRGSPPGISQTWSAKWTIETSVELCAGSYRPLPGGLYVGRGMDRWRHLWPIMAVKLWDAR